MPSFKSLWVLGICVLAGLFNACKEPPLEAPDSACFQLLKDSLFVTVRTLNLPGGGTLQDTVREIRQVPANTFRLGQPVIVKDCGNSDYARLFTNADVVSDSVIVVKHNSPVSLYASNEGTSVFRYKTAGTKRVIYETYNVAWKNVDGKWEGRQSETRRQQLTVTVTVN